MMIPIKELINKIKWDKRESPGDYILGYEDRVSGKIIETAYPDIERLEGNFMIIFREGEEKHIPMHRVRVVKKKGKIIWQRKLSED